jgi:hypothetical protein
MATQDASFSSEDELFANAFFFFLQELSLMSKGPKEQCEEKQYDNVAWELKNFFIRSAEGVLNTPGGRLSDHQTFSVRDLVDNVSSIPGDVINIARSNLREEYIRAMSDPCWIPLRVQAKDLMSLLESETQRIHSILFKPNDQGDDPKAI